MDGGVQAHLWVEPGFNVACTRAVDQRMGHPQLSQQLETALRHRHFLGAAQQHQVAAGSLMVERQFAAEHLQPQLAVARQAVHACPVRCVDRRAARSPPAPHPAPLAGCHGPSQANRAVWAEQVTQHFGRHAGCGPRGDIARRDHTGVGKAGLLGHACAALEDRHLMTVACQFERRRHADDAGADHCNPHGQRPLLERAAANVDSMARLTPRTASSLIAGPQTISPTGI